MPRVSVIIPAYNAASTIARTIESVRRQTYEDLEIIIVDDGCTDDTTSRVEAIGDPRIRLRSYPNGGLSVARNRGIVEARGEYVAFLDADDLWAKTKLESHLAVFDRRKEIGGVYSWTCTIDATDRVVGSHTTATWAGDVYARLLESFFIGNASNVIVRREVIDSVGMFNEALDRGEDWEFTVRAATRWLFDVVPRYQVFYRWRDGSISSDPGRMRDGLVVTVDRMFDQAPAELQALKPRSLASVHVYIARTYLTRCSDQAAVREAARSLHAALRLRPQVVGDPVVLRLCIRWLLAWMSSPQRAGALADRYHQARNGGLSGVNPWD